MQDLDLLYLVHSPYTSGQDSAITYANLASTLNAGSVLLAPTGAQTITGYGLTVPSITLGTPLAITSGGTGVGSVTIAPTASAFAGWDANKNFTANNTIDSYVTTVSSATPIVLTVGSPYQQFITGSTAQTIILPVANTLVVGQSFLVVNNSSAVCTVTASGGATVTAMAANTQSIFTCILASGTTAASWNSDYGYETIGVATITGTANQVIASSPTGAVTLSLPQSIASTSTPTFASLTLTNPLTLANGGTGTAITASNGGIFYSTASAGALLSGTATANLPLLSGSTAAPTWGSFALSLGGALTTAGAHTLSGAFASTFTMTGTTTVTFPTSGTLATTAQLSNFWVDQTGASVTMATNTGYTSDDGATLVTFTLPTTSAIGDFVEINGKGSGLWKIAQAAGQQINISGGTATTSGTGGSLASVNQFDCVRLRCVTANTIWNVVSQQSTGLTVV
jgi:hypothetical protein